MKKQQTNLKIDYVPLGTLKHAEYNPRVWSKDATAQLKKSIRKFGIVDPLLVNSAPERRGVVIGGNFRMSIFKELGIAECPVVWVNIPDLERERELCVRLNRNTGEFDWKLLETFGEDFLADVGFTSEELDDIFGFEETPEEFDLAKELKKIGIERVSMKKGEIYELGSHRIIIGDSTIEKDVLRLFDGEKANLCLTDPPYILDYLRGKKRNGKATTGFGYKRDRRYLETESLPPDFTEKWMKNIHKIQNDNFSIIVYENWKNIRTIWGAMEKYWKVKNMIVWHLKNRTQGFAAKYKFFSKYDIAMVGTTENALPVNSNEETEGLQNEYESALFAISGKPQWEPYEKGKKIQPTDFIEFPASDAKNSGQGIVFGTKPVEILIPYIKVLTKRGDLVAEPFGGSGSTLIAAERMQRRCFLVEKSPVYAEVIKRRWEKLTGRKARKLS